MTKEGIIHNTGLITLIGFVVLIIVLIAFANNQQGTFNPPYLRLALNVIFITATNIFVAIVSATSFLRHGHISFLLLSGALFVSGLSAFLSGWFSGNASFIIFNVGFLLSAIMQAFGAVYLSAASPTSKVYSNRKLLILLVLLFSIISVSIITVLSVLHITPPFIAETGATTDLRQFVVGLSFIFFVFASSVFAYQYLRSKARALYWYSLALALFAVDTIVAYNSAQLADALQWAGRFSDYAGGIFFIIAFLTLREQAYIGADYSERWFETLSNNRVQLAALFANMLSGFAYLRVIPDKEGNPTDAIFLEVNQAFEQNTGLKRKDILGKRLTQVIKGIEQDPAHWVNIFGDVALKGKPTRVDNYIVGLQRWLRVSAYSPEKRYVAVIFEDITEQKDLQRKLEEYAKNLEQIVEERTKQLRVSERLAGIGQTAGMVGHDIRNPLQAITGDLYLIEQEIKTKPTCVSPDIAESIAAINENINYINKIVSDLQDYTRALKPALATVNLKDVINGGLTGLKIPPNIRVEVNTETDLKLKTDSTFLRRILTNLITNAVQAMPDGGKLSIEAFKEGNTAFICIQDTGVGIPENAKPNLFKPLFTTKAKGQGLGLAVVKRLVEILNGRITFESQEGKGTKFKIELPLENQ